MFCTMRNAPAVTAKAETVSVWWSDVPSVDDHTKSTSAGATAASVALRRNASQSATLATAQVVITARSSVPSVTGAGAGAVRSTCQPPRSCRSSVSNVEDVGRPNVVVDGTSAHTMYAASATTTNPTPIHAGHRRAR